MNIEPLKGRLGPNMMMMQSADRSHLPLWTFQTPLPTANANTNTLALCSLALCLLFLLQVTSCFVSIAWIRIYRPKLKLSLTVLSQWLTFVVTTTTRNETERVSQIVLEEKRRQSELDNFSYYQLEIIKMVNIYQKRFEKIHKKFDKFCLLVGKK